MGGNHFIGKVVSNRMLKTVKVITNYAVWRNRLCVYERRVGQYYAHDPKQECNIGDIVRIIFTRNRRGVRYRKNYVVADIIRRAHVFDADKVKQLVAQREAAGVLDYVDVCKKKVKEAEEKLYKMRELYAKYHGNQPLTGSIFPQLQLGSGFISRERLEQLKSKQQPQQIQR